MPSALWRPGAGAWADDPAGATPRPDGGDAGRRRVRRRGVPPGHAGLLPRGGAGPQPLRSGRPHQAAAAAPVPGLDPELRAAAGHGASAAAGPGPGPARQAVRRRQPGVPVPWPLRPAPGSARREAPALVVDSHEIAYDLARQFARAGGSLGRRLYAGANWRKLRREELGTYRDADGVYLCSAADERRLLDQVPGARTAVIPNAADVEYYQPRPTDPPPDGRTVVYFGLLSTVPNVDGVTHFVQDIWPRIAEAHPEARCKIIGGRPPPSLLALAGPRVELTGFVSDLRPHLAAAAAVVVPLRLGGGTRLKIVEAMAMGKAIVSTTLGAEGIEAVPGRDLLVEDEPAAFADAVNRLLAEPDLAARIGQSARQLAVERYAWSGAARALEGFYRRILEVGS